MHIDAGAAEVTLGASGTELVSAPPEDYDPCVELPRYERVVAGLGQALELSEAEADGPRGRAWMRC